MEGLLAVIAVAWIVISVIASGVKGAKKGAARDNEKTQPPQKARKVTPQPKSTIWTQITEMMEEGAKDEGAVRETVTSEGMSRADAVRETLASERMSRADAVRETVTSEGMSREDAGCLGGSIEHTQHEGGTLQGLDREMPSDRYQASSTQKEKVRVARRAGAENSPSIVQKAKEESALSAAPFAVSAEDMRRAVVMSEVLGKPVSMRRRAG
ncbi:MAG: hypothetical protein RR739_00790 [Clostridia bacterium]